MKPVYIDANVFLQKINEVLTTLKADTQAEVTNNIIPLLLDVPTADVVSREQFNLLYDEKLKLQKELNNLAGEELPWVVVSCRSNKKGESAFRYHCPHCGYSHKKTSHYCSNCGRRCKT